MLAGPAAVCCKRLLQVLDDAYDILRCEALDHAVERIQHESPHLIVLCYLFDEMRPFRLVHHVRNDPRPVQTHMPLLRNDLRRPDLPILLVQPVDWHLDDAQIKQMSDAYESIGINGFVNFHEDVETYGEKMALQRFRTAVTSLLHSRSLKAGTPG